MTDKENILKIIAEKANQYNIKPLLDYVCNYYESPNTVRKHLMQCYFLCTEYILKTGLDVSEYLSTLSMIIEAIDDMTQTPNTPNDRPKLTVEVLRCTI